MLVGGALSVGGDDARLAYGVRGEGGVQDGSRGKTGDVVLRCTTCSVEVATAGSLLCPCDGVE